MLAPVDEGTANSVVGTRGTKATHSPSVFSCLLTRNHVANVNMQHTFSCRMPCGVAYLSGHPAASRWSRSTPTRQRRRRRHHHNTNNKKGATKRRAAGEVQKAALLLLQWCWTLRTIPLRWSGFSRRCAGGRWDWWWVAAGGERGFSFFKFGSRPR